MRTTPQTTLCGTQCLPLIWKSKKNLSPQDAEIIGEMRKCAGAEEEYRHMVGASHIEDPIFLFLRN